MKKFFINDRTKLIFSRKNLPKVNVINGLARRSVKVMPKWSVVYLSKLNKRVQNSKFGGKCIKTLDTTKPFRRSKSVIRAVQLAPIGPGLQTVLNISAGVLNLTIVVITVVEFRKP